MYMGTSVVYYCSLLWLFDANWQEHVASQVRSREISSYVSVVGHLEKIGVKNRVVILCSGLNMEVRVCMCVCV